MIDATSGGHYVAFHMGLSSEGRATAPALSMSIWDNIDPDPDVPLSVEEFKQCFSSHLWALFEPTDEKIAKAFPEPDAIKRRLDNAVRSEKFQMYKEIYWEKLERYELDP